MARPSTGKFAAVGALVVAVVVLFATVALQAVAAANAVRIGELESELTEAGRQYMRTVTELERARRPDVLREHASELGLQPPERGQVVVP